MGLTLVLLIEDDPGDAALFNRMLDRSTLRRFVTVRIADLPPLRAALKARAPDVVVADLTLPSSRGFDTVEEVLRVVDGAAPVVVLTGADEAGLGILAVQYGAQDYLRKRATDAGALQRALAYAVERHALLSQIDRCALLDPVTSLPQRWLLEDRLQVALDRAQPGHAPVHVVQIALPRGHGLDARVGRPAMDILFSLMAQRLTAALGGAGTAARIAREVFVCTVECMPSDDAALGLIERLLAELRRPFDVPVTVLKSGPRLEGIHVAVRAGVARGTAGYRIASDILREAEKALHLAMAESLDRPRFATQFPLGIPPEVA